MLHQKSLVIHLPRPPIEPHHDPNEAQNGRGAADEGARVEKREDGRPRPATLAGPLRITTLQQPFPTDLAGRDRASTAPRVRIPPLLVVVGRQGGTAGNVEMPGAVAVAARNGLLAMPAAARQVEAAVVWPGPAIHLPPEDDRPNAMGLRRAFGQALVGVDHVADRTLKEHVEGIDEEHGGIGRHLLQGARQEHILLQEDIQRAVPVQMFVGQLDSAALLQAQDPQEAAGHLHAPRHVTHQRPHGPEAIRKGQHLWST